MIKMNPPLVKPKNLKLIPGNKFKSLNVFKLSKRAKAAVVLDEEGRPHFFLFDTVAFLDIFSQIDEALVDKLPIEEYHSKTINPAGYLIDELESRLPLNPKFVASLKAAIEEADKKGWIPFSKIQTDLGLT